MSPGVLPQSARRRSSLRPALFLRTFLAGFAIAGLYTWLHNLVMSVLCVEYLLLTLPSWVAAGTPFSVAGAWTSIHLVLVVLPLAAGVSLASVLGREAPLPTSHVLRPIGALLVRLVLSSGLCAAIGHAIGTLQERWSPELLLANGLVVDPPAFRAAEGLALSTMVIGWSLTMFLIGDLVRRRYAHGSAVDSSFRSRPR